MALTESVPMTTEELESLVQAINDRRAGRRTLEEPDHEIIWLTGRVIRPYLRITPQPR